MKKFKKQLKLMSWLTLALILAVTVWFSTEIVNHARMETNLDKYMPHNHPAFIYSDQAEEWFNIKDGILIAIENKDGIFNPQTLSKVKEISLGLLSMDEFEEIDIQSLYTADNIVGTEDGLDVTSFFDEVPETAQELADLRENVVDNDMVYRRLVSEDETVALVVAAMDDEYFTDEFYRRILDFAHSFESSTEIIYVAGRPIVEGTMGLLGPADMKRMVPIVLIVIALVLYLLLKRSSATVSIMITVFISTIWAFGLMAALKIPIYAVSTMIPVMLIAIGVAYGVYFYQYLQQYFHNNPESDLITALKSVIKRLSVPLFMAAFTTIIGFLSLLTSQVYPIKYFGIFTSFGIFVTFALALWFLPSWVILFGYRVQNVSSKKPRKKTGKVNLSAGNITQILLNKKRTVFIITAVVVAFSIYGVTKVWINSSFLANFEKDSDIVLTDKFVNSKFGGTSTLNVILESEEYDAFKQPDALTLIDEMQHEAVKLSRVGNSFSLADYLKRMNKVMNADSDEFYTIPETSDMVAQYLLLYEMSGDPENLVRIINYDYNRTNVTFQLKGDDSQTINEALTVIKKFEKPLGDMGVSINYAGSGYKALVFTDLILEGQIKSILVSLVLVLLLLTFMFKSIKAGLIGSTPIAITALISFGVMGALNIPLSTTTALLSSIAIGIGIDYAIHFLQNYRMNLKTESNQLDAIKTTMLHTGKAITFNAVVVISGFLVLLFSVFPPNRTLGALVSMNMFTSFLGTLTLLMILVFGFKVFIKKNNSTKVEKKSRL